MKDPKLSNICVCILLLLTMLVILYSMYDDDKCKFTLMHNRYIDEKSEEELSEIQRIEKIITDLKKRRALNKSTNRKVLNSIKLGIVRGVIGGVLLGSGGVAISAITFGSIGGIMTGSTIILNRGKFVDAEDSSAY